MSYTDIGDNELVYLIRSGNDVAKEVLIQRYRKRIFGMVHSFAKKNNLNNIDYEDYACEGFIVFLKCLEKYDEEYNFYTYVEEAINRRLIKILVKENMYSRISDLKENVIQGLDCINDSESEYKMYEIQKIIKENLDDDSKKIIELRISGYSYSEIAELMNMNKKTLYKKNNKIKEILKRKLK